MLEIVCPFVAFSSYSALLASGEASLHGGKYSTSLFFPAIHILHCLILAREKLFSFEIVQIVIFSSASFQK